MKTYIGDGVYAKWEEIGALTLTTENGAGVTNVIVIEPEVWVALVEYMKRSVPHIEGKPWAS